MQRNIYALIVGIGVAGVAALAACSGGGSSPNPIAPITSQAPGSGSTSPTTTGSMKLTLTINRNPQSTKRPFAASRSARRGTAATRKPQYISQHPVSGLQISVSANGTTKTVYADISAGTSGPPVVPESPLCTTTSGVETCTITVPTLGSSETISATEVDQPPTNEVTSGNGAGYGSGFPTNSHVLAAGSTTATVAGGASLALGLGPVIASGNDTGCLFFFPSSSPTSNYNGDYDYTSYPGRFVVTAGVAQAFLDCIVWYDASGATGDSNATPVPLSDVNGSPEPYTITSSAQHIGVEFYTPAELNATFPPATPGPSATVAQVPDTSYNFGTFFVYGLAVDGQQPAVATIVESNNLSATLSPYVTATPYASSETLGVATLTVSPATSSVSLSGTDTTTITATDYLGSGGLSPFGSVNNTIGRQNAGECISTSDGVTPLASVAAVGAISTTTWQQAFQVTGTAQGTCSFVLSDNNTYNNGYQGNGVITPVVTITVNP